MPHIPHSPYMKSQFRDGLGARLRIVEKKFRNRAEASRNAGVAKSTLQNWIEGRSDASFEGLSRLAFAGGVSLDWLAYGNGEMEGPRDGFGEPGTAPSAIDIELLARVLGRFDRLTADATEDRGRIDHARFIAYLYQQYASLDDAARQDTQVMDSLIRLFLEHADIGLIFRQHLSDRFGTDNFKDLMQNQRAEFRAWVDEFLHIVRDTVRAS